MLHVLTGASCNNNCIFCMESDREGRHKHASAQSPADIQRMIERYPIKDEVLFTSGEPTLNPDLPAYIDAARRVGFTTIALITNGRRLAYEDYTKSLVNRGLNKVTVSIHGHTAKMHDGLVRTRGAFEQSLKGLRALLRLKQSWQLEIHTSTVVVQRNLPCIGEIHALLAREGVDRLCFNVMMLKGRGAEKFDILMARYSDICKRFSKLAADLNAAEARQVSLADVPRCTLGELAFELIGDQEAFDQFEVLGSNGIAQLSAEDLDQLGRTRIEKHESAARLQSLLEGEAELHGDAEYYLTNRELKDNILRVKRAECVDCKHDRRCPGVWETYVNQHGWNEFEPVRGSEP